MRRRFREGDDEAELSLSIGVFRNVSMRELLNFRSNERTVPNQHMVTLEMAQ